MDNKQTEMAFMQQGGIKDDGMKKDPVSGNDIPPGSMASEVRDDIPAMLSEGEYVVPADVLRFYGVNFFEDLRNKAKSGLQNMEQNGRIGGEPLSPQDIQRNMGSAPQAQSPARMPNPMQANQGALVGYQTGGGPIPDEYTLRAQALGGGFQPSNVVGGSLFGNQQSQQQAQPDSITSFKTFVNSTDGSTRIVEFVDGNVKNPNMEQYTKPPYYEQGSAALKQAQQATTNRSDGGGDGGPDTGGDTGETGSGTSQFGVDVDWSDPEAYAKSVMEGGLGDFAQKGLQYGSAALGPAAMGIAGAGLAANSLNQISNMRASSIIARAQGLNDQAEAIDKMVADFISEQPDIVQFLGDDVGMAQGTQKAQTVMDRIGFVGKKGKTGNYEFTPEQIAQNKSKTEQRSAASDQMKEILSEAEIEAKAAMQRAAEQRSDDSDDRRAESAAERARESYERNKEKDQLAQSKKGSMTGSKSGYFD